MVRIYKTSVKTSEKRKYISDENAIKKEMMHHVVFIVDRASKIVSIMVFGILSDGSVDTRSYGWGRIYPLLKDINNTYKCSYNPYFKGKIYHMRVYNRYLRTSEAIANFNAGLKEK